MTEEQTTENVETTEEKKEEEQQPETFSREYVENLRKENADYRTRAKKSEELQSRLLAAVVKLSAPTLNDPADVLKHRNAEDLLDDDGFPSEEKITAAAESLVSEKPYLAVRKPTGDVGQGAREEQPTQPGLADTLRSLAG